MLIDCEKGSAPSSIKSLRIGSAHAGGRYVISQHNVSLTVDPHLGGRIVSLTCDGDEVLYTQGDMCGSTFWPSPQNVWHWPPPAAIDNQPYQIEEKDTSFSILSSVCPATGLQVRKKIHIDKSGCIKISYEMINNSSQDVRFSPWEITRVCAGGTVFFPQGDDISVSSDLVPTREDSIVWYNRRDNKKKLFRDGLEGWIAHLAGRHVLIKSWEEDVQPVDFAPNEAEIELYSATDYLEVEVQGKYLPMSPGQTVTWDVYWRLKVVPNTIDTRIGSPALVDFVRKHVGIDS
ncbi:MAG: DUF4380 domain-containing protein [Fibrobacterota bacterium]